MKLLFLFLDGVGLGADDPSINPLAAVPMPNLRRLLGGSPLTLASAPYSGEAADLLALDACLGVAGLPQSATGQAVLLTGLNIPAEIGYHYGPKPNEPVAAYLRNGSIFSRMKNNGRSAAFLNAYPPRYFAGIESGKRLLSAIPLAVSSAGFRLYTQEDLVHGRAIAADFTAQGWRDHLGLTDTPVLSPEGAGERMSGLAQQVDFALFEFWLSDYVGHHQSMEEAFQILETLDRVLGGLVESWDHEQGLILLTSDHGNLEDLSTRRHTLNPVPGLVIGSKRLRRPFSARLRSLQDITPAILAAFQVVES
jgi:hypothetical protein